MNVIRIPGARENNLRDVSVELPKHRLIVVTGVSGSGKSSLVFDTIAAEAQRQLNETFTTFIRNRLPGAGHHGGQILFEGTPEELLQNKQSLTAEHLRRAVA
jgi:excinuclease UvrABC ATPase subunit